MFIGDVKYKKLQAAGFQHTDLYQLLAYLVATDLPHGLLIYAAGKSRLGNDVFHIDGTPKVMTLDLIGTPEQVLDQIPSVARLIIDS